MKKKVKWGILSTATIAVEEVIPAMINSTHCEILAIGSRDAIKARKVSQQFNIPFHYGSYDDLLSNKEIDAIYIPLPNHLHVQWAIKSLKAGKHVLLEKPVGLTSEEARYLMEFSKNYSKLKIMEAFMYRHHPQWIETKAWVKNGEIGDLKAIQASFSFYDDDPNSIVNNKDFGGGSLMDIGCYPISVARYLFESEPEKVYSKIEFHPDYLVDTFVSGILEFKNGTCDFFSGIRLGDHQSVKILGSKGAIEFEMPFNPSDNVPTKIWLTKDSLKREIEFDICNQYTQQADYFSQCIIKDNKVVPNLVDSIGNMVIIEKLLESNLKGKAIEI